ncbi:MAG: hypothetical protein ACHQAX_03545 [Gammaproteobacteria bacterium]
MSQMINLLNSIPKAPVDHSLFAPQNTIKAAMGMTIVFTLYMGSVILDRIYQGVAFEKASAESILAQDVLDDMKAKYPDPKKNFLEARAKDIEQQIAIKKSMLNLLTSDTLSPHGYTPFLEVLSADILQGVWLTTIEIDIGENFVGMQGMSISGPLVVKFVDHLSKEKIFKDIKMGMFKMTQSDQKGSFLAFELSNDAHRALGGAHEDPL